MQRTRYADPYRVREPADAKIGGRLIRRRAGEPRQWWACTSWPVPRSKYEPHQGEKEKARRRAQMLKAYGRDPVARFYGSLSGGEV